MLSYPSLMIVDEIGYLPVSQTGAVLFFQLISRRHDRASTILTSNKGFEEWGEVLGDEVMAAALIDRILHHCQIVNIRGNSYRMRQHTELWKSLQEGNLKLLPDLHVYAGTVGRSGHRKGSAPRAKCTIFNR